MTTSRLFSMLLIGALSTVSSPAIVYVDLAATGAGDGSSWANAFTNLQAALSTAPPESEYWAHAGIYASCTLRTNAAVYGGFAGSETTRESRDWRSFPTVIDGSGGRAVTFAAGATLDGFVITNSAGQGGAVTLDRVHGALINCRIVGNTGGDALLLQSTGGHNGAPTVIRNCEFADNRDGSAIFYYGRTNLFMGPHLVIIDRCTFVGNQSTGRGGAISTDHAGHWLQIVNCVFVQNTASLTGGALYTGYSQYGPGTPVGVYNCTFYSNAAPAGKAVCVSFQQAQAALWNCIVWGATNDQLRTQSDTPTLSVGYSDLQGGFASANPRHGTILNLGDLLDADPRFVDPDGADAIPGTLDDNLRLAVDSPCIDAGTMTGAPAHDRDGLVRPQGFRTDIGAYESGGGPPPNGVLLRVR